jgi:hypothetical protein
LQTVVVAAVMLWYHWGVARTDSRRGAEGRTLYKAVTLLAGAEARELVPRLEKVLGFKIRTLNLLGEPGEKPLSLSEEEVSQLVQDIQLSPGTQVMLVAMEGKITVLPYHE